MNGEQGGRVLDELVDEDREDGVSEKAGPSRGSAAIGEEDFDRPVDRSVPRSTARDEADHARLRHARDRDVGFPVGRYLQPAPLLFTRDGHNVFLGDQYRGAAAFLICGGPSLASHDLSRLEQRGVLTMAVNNAAAVYRPHLWCSVDDPGNFVDAIWRDPGITKFVPLCHMEKHFTVRDDDGDLRPSTEVVGDMPMVFGFRRNEDFVAERWLYEDTLNWGNHSKRVDTLGNRGSRSVMYPALRLLFHLGVRRVFLLGCDFRMRHNARNYAFEQDRSRASVRGNNGSYRVLNARLAALRPHFEAEGFSIANCTPGSGLTAFEKLSFEEAVAEAVSRLPVRIVTRGMYDRQAREREARAETRDTENDVRLGDPRLPPTTLVVSPPRASDGGTGTVSTWWTHKRGIADLSRVAVLAPSDDERNLASELRGDRTVLVHADLSPIRRLKTALACVETPWFLWLDGTCVATGRGAWVDPGWFANDATVLVAPRWGYSKPADVVEQLDRWADTDDCLGTHDRLRLSFDPADDRVRHDTISDWCLFGRTDWCRDMLGSHTSATPTDRLATFLQYCAARSGRQVVRVNMKARGWDHSFGWTERRLRRRSREALAAVEGGDGR